MRDGARREHATRFWVVPIAHVVKVLRELGQVGTLLLVLLLGPKQDLWDLKGRRDVFE